MDDYAMGLFLAAKRDIESRPNFSAKYLCLALKHALETEGMEYKTSDVWEIFPQFASAYDGKHFNRGTLLDDGFPRTSENVWWHPPADPVPRIAMIDFLVGK